MVVTGKSSTSSLHTRSTKPFREFITRVTKGVRWYHMLSVIFTVLAITKISRSHVARSTQRNFIRFHRNSRHINCWVVGHFIVVTGDIVIECLFFFGFLKSLILIGHGRIKSNEDEECHPAWIVRVVKGEIKRFTGTRRSDGKFSGWLQRWKGTKRKENVCQFLTAEHTSADTMSHCSSWKKLNGS